MTEEKPRKPTPEEAFEVYLRLGRDRTLDKVAQHFKNSPEWLNVSRSTIHRWSGAHDWQRQLTEHSLRVQQATRRRMADREADQQVASAETFHSATLDALLTLAHHLKAFKPTTIDELERVAKIAIDLSTQGLEMERGAMPPNAAIDRLLALADKIGPNGEMRDVTPQALPKPEADPPKKDFLATLQEIPDPPEEEG